MGYTPSAQASRDSKVRKTGDGEVGGGLRKGEREGGDSVTRTHPSFLAKVYSWAPCLADMVRCKHELYDTCIL